jgi:hypothetical protein
MWKAGVAAAVAGIAAFVAVVVAGRGYVEPEPLESGLVAVPERSWAERAGQLCRESMGAVRAELAGPGGLETQEAQALRLYRETTRIEGALVERLRELPDAPEEARSTVALLARQHERDTKTVRRLEEELDPQLILREIAAYEKLATRLRARFDELGAQGCVRYLDPASYG